MRWISLLKMEEKRAHDDCDMEGLGRYKHVEEVAATLTVERLWIVGDMKELEQLHIYSGILGTTVYETGKEGWYRILRLRIVCPYYSNYGLKCLHRNSNEILSIFS